ncbi:orotate phosphoribosyltransferase [uncultured Limosilactobacillus sp.]|uniref:orotate phosphoribosyltransferase n=1 Tax=uncultured Limosilactobacillus sp. TaxID=2837629 RepID=UPI0025F03446|nr:orotate phosphoribosyltransferase [uncultured Limosilactobacillus sp.]
METTARDDQVAAQVAADLLNIKAVTLHPSQPFTWASGLHSPIYTDNRLTISYPAVRRHIFRGMAALISRYFNAAEVIAGTATAGIPHASWVADELNLPLIYVRSKPKDHGRGKQLEGVLKPGQKVVVIDDLISTGGSVLKAVNAVRKAGGEVIGIVSVFTYQLPAATANFKAAGLTYHSVTNYTKLIETAEAQQLISSDERQSLHAWRQDPQAWSDAH